MDYFVDYNAILKVVYSNNPWGWLASRVGQVVPRWISSTFPFWCLCGEGKNAWPNRAPQQFSKPRQLRDFQMGDPRCSGQGHTSCNFWLQTCQTSIAYDIVLFTTDMIIPLQVEFLVHTWKIVHGNPGKYNVNIPSTSHNNFNRSHCPRIRFVSIPSCDGCRWDRSCYQKEKIGYELAENRTRGLTKDSLKHTELLWLFW